MSTKSTPEPLLTPKMAAELWWELYGISCSANEPAQYDDKIAALKAIASGTHWVVRARTGKQGDAS